MSNRIIGKLGWLLSEDNKTDYYIFYFSDTKDLIIMSKKYALHIYDSLKKSYYFSNYIRWNKNSLGSYIPISLEKLSDYRYSFNNFFTYEHYNMKEIYAGD